MGFFKERVLPWLAAAGSIFLGVLMFIFGRKSLGGKRAEGSKQGGTDSASTKLRQQLQSDSERIGRERDWISTERDSIEREREILNDERARVSTIRSIIDNQRASVRRDKKGKE